VEGKQPMNDLAFALIGGLGLILATACFMLALSQRWK
jgi:hypothetical protein